MDFSWTLKVHRQPRYVIEKKFFARITNNNISPHPYILIKVYEGFLNCLKWIDEKLDKPRIFIGENGFPENQGVDESDKKVAYHTVRLIQFYSDFPDNVVFRYLRVFFVLGHFEQTFGSVGQQY